MALIPNTSTNADWNALVALTNQPGAPIVAQDMVNTTNAMVRTGPLDPVTVVEGTLAPGVIPDTSPVLALERPGAHAHGEDDQMVEEDVVQTAFFDPSSGRQVPPVHSSILGAATIDKRMEQYTLPDGTKIVRGRSRHRRKRRSGSSSSSSSSSNGSSYESEADGRSTSVKRTREMLSPTGETPSTKRNIAKVKESVPIPTLPGPSLTLPTVEEVPASAVHSGPSGSGNVHELLSVPPPPPPPLILLLA